MEKYSKYKHEKVPLIEVISDGESDSFGKWHEAAKPFFDTRAVEDYHEFSGSVKSSLLDNLLITLVTFSQQEFFRSYQHLRNNNFFYVLELYLQGNSLGEIGDFSIKMKPGRIYLFDYANCLKTRSVSEYSRVISVIIPRHLIKVDLQEYQPAIFFETNSATGKILNYNILHLIENLPYITQKEAPAIAAGFIGLLNGLLLSDQRLEKMEVIKKNIFIAMRLFIQQNLSDPYLGVEILCEQFNYSRASLYRLFKQVGGVKQYITQKRLDLSYDLLKSGKMNNLSLSEIAKICGFTNLATFSSLFKKKYQLCPSDFKNTQQQLGGYYNQTLENSRDFQDKITMLHQWTYYTTDCNDAAKNIH